jgi:Histidine kinase
MEDLAATSILAGRETPGSPVAAPRADIDPSLIWLAITPLWAIVSFGRVSAYALDQRFPAIIPPIRTAALQSLLLWPLAVLGCWLTLRAWGRGGSVLPLFVTMASPVALGALAWPAYGLAALFLSSADERHPDVSYPWLSNGIEYSILYVCCVAAAVGAIAYRQWSVERTGRTHAENLAALERLRALRAQINPHFLFNALNSIVGMNNSAVSESQDLMAGLSDLLRRTTAASEREQHTVAEELAYAATYLKIQGVRHAQLRSEIAVDPSCNDALIPTLVLVSLVENAVSHGLRGTQAGAGTLVEIFGKCDETSLTLVVRNAAPPAAAAPDQILHQGTGLKLLRERLEILYGSAARLRTRRPDPAHFEAALMVPLHRPRSPGLHRETRQ